MAEDIKNKCKLLKNKRSHLKRNLTILEGYVDVYDSLSPTDAIKIKNQFESCERNVLNYESYLEEVFDEEHANEFDQYFIDAQIADRVAKLKLKVSEIFEERATSASTAGSSSQQSSRLPPTNLPIFTGNYHDWLSFKDQFNNLIDSKEYLSVIDKLQYLKSYKR